MKGDGADGQKQGKIAQRSQMIEDFLRPKANWVTDGGTQLRERHISAPIPIPIQISVHPLTAAWERARNVDFAPNYSLVSSLTISEVDQNVALAVANWVDTVEEESQATATRGQNPNENSGSKSDLEDDLFLLTQEAELAAAAAGSNDSNLESEGHTELAAAASFLDDSDLESEGQDEKNLATNPMPFRYLTARQTSRINCWLSCVESGVTEETSTETETTNENPSLQQNKADPSGLTRRGAIKVVSGRHDPGHSQHRLQSRGSLIPTIRRNGPMIQGTAHVQNGSEDPLAPEPLRQSNPLRPLNQIPSTRLEPLEENDAESAPKYVIPARLLRFESMRPKSPPMVLKSHFSSDSSIEQQSLPVAVPKHRQTRLNSDSSIEQHSLPVAAPKHTQTRLNGEEAASSSREAIPRINATQTGHHELTLARLEGRTYSPSTTLAHRPGNLILYQHNIAREDNNIPLLHYSRVLDLDYGENMSGQFASGNANEFTSGDTISHPPTTAQMIPRRTVPKHPAPEQFNFF